MADATDPVVDPATRPGSWTALVSPAAAMSCVETTRAIAARTVSERTATIRRDWGPALLHAYLSLVDGSESHRSRALALVDDAIESTFGEVRSASLYGGFTGSAWLCAHVESLVESQHDETYEVVDTALLRMLGDRNRRWSYDLADGLTGVGRYFLERLPSSRAADGLLLVVRRLGALAERTQQGVCWRVLPEAVPECHGQRAPHGYYDFSVAHGICGVLTFLAAVRRECAQMGEANDLLREASRWLLERREDDRFPSLLIPGTAPNDFRTGWWDGELGVSAALIAAGRSLNDLAVEQFGVGLASKAANMALAESSVSDGGLCRGAVGVAHALNRLAQTTGRGELRDAAAAWFDRAFAMQQIAARRTVNRADEDQSFLTGAAGAALAMLAASTAVEPDWDRVTLGVHDCRRNTKECPAFSMSPPVVLRPPDGQTLHPPSVSSLATRSVQRYVLSLLQRKAYEKASEICAARAVLDWGCNDGYGMEMLRSTAASIAGLDTSAAALELARSRPGLLDCRFELFDFVRCPFQPSSFDAVTCFQVLEHVDDAAGFIDMLRSLLREDGLLLLTTPNGAIRLNPGLAPWNPLHVREFTARSLQDVLSPRFRRVELYGLFATPELDRIERTRIVQRKRHQLEVWRGQQGHPPESTPLSQDAIDRFSLGDLFYARDNHELALDLMAACWI